MKIDNKKAKERFEDRQKEKEELKNQCKKTSRIEKDQQMLFRLLGGQKGWF